VLLGCGENGSNSDTQKAEQPAVKSETPDFSKLVGRWRRPDGGYVIEVRNVASDGSADASYYNPNPINVAESKAFRRDGKIGIFIKMEDRNYPGSTYDLVYDPGSEYLVGIYYQATMNQEFDVAFQKIQ
jgi:hypothetical protein